MLPFQSCNSSQVGMPQCSVPFCVETGGHEFPKSPERRKRWAIAIKRGQAGGKLWQPTPHAIVCYRHFLKEDYVEYNKQGN